MKYTEVKTGRTFVLRLEDGDIIHETIEQFAIDKKFNTALVMFLGGADKNSKLVVGPKEGRASHIEPMEHILEDVHEVAGVGTIFPNENGVPVLHAHLTAGRNNKAVTGCIRRGVKVWLILEVVIQEFTDCSALRRLEPDSGFELLQVK